MGAAEPLLEPVVVRLTALLVPLMRLSGLVVVLGIIFAADAFVRALFGTATSTVGWIPYAGKLLTSPVHRIEQKITNYLGGLETHIDVSMGGFFQNLAIVTEMLANGSAEVAIFDHFVVQKLRGTHNPAQLKPAIKHAQATATHAQATTISAARTTHAHGEQIAHAAPATVVPRVNALTHAIDVTIPREVAGLRERTKALEDGAVKTFEWIRTHPKATAAAAFTGAVTWALARVGAGWIRCSNWKRLGRGICGVPSNLIGDLLSLVADFFILTNICTVIPWLEEAFSLVAAPLVSTLAKAGAGMCRVGSHAPATLDVPQLSLPAASVPTLYLP